MIDFLMFVAVYLLGLFTPKIIQKFITKKDDDDFAGKYRNPPKSGPRMRTLGRGGQ